MTTYYTNVNNTYTATGNGTITSPWSRTQLFGENIAPEINTIITHVWYDLDLSLIYIDGEGNYNDSLYTTPSTFGCIPNQTVNEIVIFDIAV